jgi:hypothetical protein
MKIKLRRTRECLHQLIKRNFCKTLTFDLNFFFSSIFFGLKRGWSFPFKKVVCAHFLLKRGV